MGHVRLRHPKTGGEWDCPAAAVDGWTKKGWERADTGSLSSKTKAELEEYAAARNINLSGATTKADIEAAIKKAEVQ